MRGSMLPPHRIEPDLAAAKRSGLRQHRRKAGGARAFGHRLLQGQKRVHRALEMRLLDQHDVGDQRAHDRHGQLADVLHRDALGERRRRRSAGCSPFSAFHIDG